mmetsp:Transcript_4250/g.12095  ORF Transcript_4250/g.12095 Transcript_4250/m.12095 type:complete len:349 (-) Transcript_4250:486-1532(-)
MQICTGDHPEDRGEARAVRSIHEEVNQSLPVPVLVHLLVLVYSGCDDFVFNDFPSKQIVFWLGEPLPCLWSLLARAGNFCDLPQFDLDEPVLSSILQGFSYVVAFKHSGPSVDILLPVLPLFKHPHLVPVRRDNHRLDVKAPALYPRSILLILELKLKRPEILLADMNVVEFSASSAVVLHVKIGLHNDVNPWSVPPLAVVTSVGNPQAAPARVVRTQPIINIFPVGLALDFRGEMRPRDNIPELMTVRVVPPRLIRAQPHSKDAIHFAVVVTPEYVVLQPTPSETTHFPDPAASHLVRLGRERVVVSVASTLLRERRRILSILRTLRIHVVHRLLGALVRLGERPQG